MSGRRNPGGVEGLYVAGVIENRSELPGEALQFVVAKR
jgi:hypothetical protein